MEILLESKTPADVSPLSVTGASVTPERRIQRKSNIKSPSMSTPREDPIPYQYSNIIINEQYPILLPILEKYHTGYKLLFNDTHYPNKKK